ncbi:MAG TPA: UDP-N-acetylmuramoyl-tripeptide--D-alanyl-D-alanine ligase [Propionibacteriaceae bacterium]|nr:UDP-N-acetylmuramoyl-tripeptide--D-alanyl-D-alanine ligase [Propionibacteriaceae bacterium]
MIAVTVDEIATVLGAELSGPGDATALVTALTADSRAVTAGALFAALRGEHVDGHDYVAAATAAGAAASLTRHPVAGALCLVVVDPLVALGRLSRYLVDRASAAGLQVVGITGSVGKTSTKDLLAQVLERAGPTVAAVGNLNNELGVPLTVGRVDEQTRFLVVEMGARGIGHIDYLCDIAPPRVGVVLNVGQAHVGEFGGQAAIARAKGELVEALPNDGWAVLNIDDPLVWSMRRRTGAKVLPWSTTQPLDDGVWASELVGDAYGRYSFVLHGGRDDQSESPVQLQLTGRHQVANAVAAAAAAVAVGLELQQIAVGLAAAGPRSRWRMELHDRSDGVTVINDSYNANPDSMRAALTTLAELGRAGRRTWAVLGDMLELGETAADEHSAIGRFAAQSGIEHLVTIGEYATRITSAAVAAGLPATRAVPVTAKTDAVAVVTRDLGPGDVVLVKASRGLALDTVADEILAAVGPRRHQDAV